VEAPERSERGGCAALFGSWRWIVVQTGLVSLSLLCACTVTELHIVIGLTAAICASCIIYIFPGLAYYQLVNAKPSAAAAAVGAAGAAVQAAGATSHWSADTSSALLSQSEASTAGGEAVLGATAAAEEAAETTAAGGVALPQVGKKDLGTMRMAVLPWMLVTLGCFTMIAGTVANAVDVIRGKTGAGGK
jgi:hypothetical protein